MAKRDFSKEIFFHTSRSGGAGGQNVNKVSTKAELRFHIESSQFLNETEKILLKEKLEKKINSDGYLQIVCQTERSQLLNKEECLRKFYKLLEKSLEKPKKRRPTKPTLASKNRRIEKKKKDSNKKEARGIKGLETGL